MEIQKEGTLWLQKLKSKRLKIKLFKKHFSALNLVFEGFFTTKKKYQGGTLKSGGAALWASQKDWW